MAIRNDIKNNDFVFPEGHKEVVLLQDFLGDTETNILKTIIKKPIKWNKKDIDIYTPNKTKRLGVYNGGGQGERVYSTLGHAITLSAMVAV